ncbi:helix-turn-helix domain-containing protein [Micromonospora chalcea]|uniref:helix-turn-helix domain-containing protein n=1 Tax=Micromonospora chalcea TaxID=1874 RepID=UPI0038158673
MTDKYFSDEPGPGRSATIAELAESLGVDEVRVRIALEQLGLQAKSSEMRLTPAVARRVRSELHSSGHVRNSTNAGRKSRAAFVPSRSSAYSAKNQLARALRSLRQNEGLTLRALAEKVGYSPSSLSAAETGASTPRWSLVEKIVRQLNGDIESFRELHQAALDETGTGHVATLAARGEKFVSNFLALDSAAHAVMDTRRQPLALSAYLEERVPSTVLTAFSSALYSMQESRFDTTLVLTRWIIEAVCAERGLEDVTAGRGIRYLHEAQHIDDRLAKWGMTVVHIGNRVIHGASPALKAEDAESALAFAAALLAQIYLINEQMREFGRRAEHD